MTTLVRWDPLRDLAAFQNEMGRVMNGLFDTAGREERAWVPALDVWETDAELVYAFDLPGIPEQEISVEVHDDTLTVTATRERTSEQEGDRYYRFERRTGAFSRAVGLPAGIDVDQIRASTADGVLEVRVPKPVEAQPRKIAVGAAPPDVEA
jgi:HSP20 family protein